MDERTSSEAFATLVTNDRYLAGALTLATSLRLNCTAHPLVCLITSSVPQDARERLSGLYDHVICVEQLDSFDQEHLALLGRPNLGVTVTKIHVWALTQYSKIVFLDADTLVLHNIDDLFSRSAPFAAAPDVGWPDCFNSGVFLCHPNHFTHRELMKQLSQSGSFDGGDQGLLNDYFRNWERLPFLYNVVSSAVYSYKPAYVRYKDAIKVFHFIGDSKPWHQRFLAPHAPNKDMSDLWWEYYDIYWREGADLLKKYRFNRGFPKPHGPMGEFPGAEANLERDERERQEKEGGTHPSRSARHVTFASHASSFPYTITYSSSFIPPPLLPAHPPAPSSSEHIPMFFAPPPSSFSRALQTFTPPTFDHALESSSLKPAPTSAPPPLAAAPSPAASTSSPSSPPSSAATPSSPRHSHHSPPTTHHPLLGTLIHGSKSSSHPSPHPHPISTHPSPPSSAPPSQAHPRSHSPASPTPPEDSSALPQSPAPLGTQPFKPSSSAFSVIAGFEVPSYPLASISTYPKDQKVAIPEYMKGDDEHEHPKAIPREEHLANLANYKLGWSTFERPKDIPKEVAEEQLQKVLDELQGLNASFEKLNIEGRFEERDELGKRIDHLNKARDNLRAYIKK